MSQRCIVRWVAGLFGGGLVLTLMGAAPQAPPLKSVPAGSPHPKVPPKLEPGVPTSGIPTGAIARLGDGRLRHAAAPTCVTFSPDSKQLISGGHDGAVRVWDVGTGKAVNTLQVPNSPVSAVRFTPDGKKLVVVFSDGQLRFLEPDTLHQTATFGVGLGRDFAISPDGTMIATDLTTGLEVTELGSGLPKLELGAGDPFAFRPDGKSIAAADPTGKVTLYLLAGGKPVLTFDHGGAVNGLVFSPDGNRIATGGNRGDEVLKVWDLATGRPVAQIKGASKPQAWVGNNTIAASNGSGVGVYDLTEKRWAGFASGASGEWAVSPDGTKVASTGNSGGLRIRMWDLTTGKQLHAENDSFPDAALLTPTADGQSVFVLAGASAFLWPIYRRVATLAGTIPGQAITAASAGGRLAIVTLKGILLYDGFDPARPLPAKPSRTCTELATGCKSVALSPDGKKLCYSGDSGRIVVADAAMGTTIRILPSMTVGLGLAFTPDGEKLAVVGRDGFLRLWWTGAVAEGEDANLWKVRIQRSQRGATVAVSPDGKLIAASSSTQMMVVNATDGTVAFTTDRQDFDDGPFQQIAFSPDGRLLITGSAGMTGAVQVWEVATHTLVHRYSTGFGAVHRLGTFADGLRAVSAGAEEVVTVWDLSFRDRKEPPTDDELLMAWKNLDSLEGTVGYPAVRCLVAGGAKCGRVIAAGLQETLDVQKKIAVWVKALGSEDFTTREAATKALLAEGLRALPAVQQTAAKAESSEARVRASEIVDRLIGKGLRVPDHGLAGDTLRLVRAVQALEDVGGSEAKALLGQIAARGGRTGDDAEAALKRMAKR